jgi:sodium-coupled neutral amino acid transporter 9
VYTARSSTTDTSSLPLLSPSLTLLSPSLTLLSSSPPLLSSSLPLLPSFLTLASCLFPLPASLCSADCLHNSHVELAKPTFGKLAGLTSLAFFVHNAIHPILRNGDPKVRNRDTCLAFCAVGICYVIVGAVGYAGFGPCGITQNFLMSYPSSDWFAFCARAAMVMQLATVYPLIAFIIRTQVRVSVLFWCGCALLV